jgi:tripartite-type tricarboxylate transporter receptor subunit TctC
VRQAAGIEIDQVVGFAAGSTTDIPARLMGQWLSQRLGQQFVIENRPGAGGNIGAETVVEAPPDGYTLLMVPPAVAANEALYENLNFNFMRDIAPAAGVVRVPNVAEVHPFFYRLAATSYKSDALTQPPIFR